MLLLNIITLEIKLMIRRAQSWLTSLLFFIIVVCFFAITLSSYPESLSKMGAVIIWIAALLAMMISLENLFRFDAEEGLIDLWLLSHSPLFLIVLGKILAHWVIYGLPLILVSPILSFLLQLPAEKLPSLIISLLLGTPVLSLTGGIGAALIVGVRSNNLLLPILVMPFYVPVLIFGAGILLADFTEPLSGYYAFMGALLLFSLGTSPFFASLALRVGANE